MIVSQREIWRQSPVDEAIEHNDPCLSLGRLTQSVQESQYGHSVKPTARYNIWSAMERQSNSKGIGVPSWVHGEDNPVAPAAWGDTDARGDHRGQL
jgi:hypothetical protein